jgi:serine phosphatase RsbU (regulator of sigma subunit)
LTKALADESYEVRRNAAEALAQIGSGATAAVPALIQTLHDDNEEVRQKTDWALRRIGIPATMANVYAMREKASGLLMLGIFISIGTVHLLLFLFYPKSVNNLYYTILMGNVVLLAGLSVVFSPVPDGAPLHRAMWIVALGIALSGLRFLYALFYTRLPKQFWVLLALWIPLVVGRYLTPELGDDSSQALLVVLLLLLFLLGACIEMFRVVLMAIIRKKDGAWVISLGFIAIIAVFILKIVNGTSVGSTSLRFLDEAVLGRFWALAVIGLLVSASTYLARNFARTSKALEAKNAQLATANQQIHTLNEQLKDENLRMGAELEITKRIQQMILPSADELRAIAELDIAGYMQPADDVGGDYYDVMQREGMVAISIGDVTGHGLESGLVMLMTQTAVQALLQSGETDPVHLLNTLNRTIYNNVQRIKTDKNLTLCLLDYQSGELKLSGQHEEMIVVRNDGTVELIDTIDLGFPIGLDDDIAAFIDQTTVQLQPGDGVVLYTDGITEAENERGEQYGLERLCEVISQYWTQSAEDIKEAVIADVRRHIGEQEVYDDITLVVMKQK